VPPSGPPRFLWLGVRWSNSAERNVANSMALPTLNEQLAAIAAQARQARPRSATSTTSLMRSAHRPSPRPPACTPLPHTSCPPKRWPIYTHRHLRWQIYPLPPRQPPRPSWNGPR
jgi:hypothetical protein